MIYVEPGQKKVSDEEVVEAFLAAGNEDVIFEEAAKWPWGNVEWILKAIEHQKGMVEMGAKFRVLWTERAAAPLSEWDSFRPREAELKREYAHLAEAFREFLRESASK